MTKRCQICGKDFETTRNLAQFCSRKCGCMNSAKIRHERAQRRIRKCGICRNEFVYSKDRTESAKFCSNDCRYKAQAINRKGIRPPQLTSGVIAKSNTEHKTGKPNIKNRYRKLFMSGEKHWNWQGGIAQINKKERVLFMETFEYKSWRKSIFERDYYSCQDCGGKSRLHAHHLKSYKDYPDLRLDVNNGMTLCEACHINIHRRKVLAWA